MFFPQDGKFVVDKELGQQLKNLTLPSDLWTKLKIGHCPGNGSNCAMVGQLVTDVNMWDFALSDQQILKWTRCK